jgi:hypothetical protein
LRLQAHEDFVRLVKDHVSAWLMRLKAEALYEAGIIDTEEMSTVLERAAAVLDKASKRAA